MPNALAAPAVQRKAVQQTAPVNKKGPIAPPVYRPQTAPRAAQLKTANGPLHRKPPVAPPVYRPERRGIAQPKTPSSPPAANGRVPGHARSTSQVAKLKAVAPDTPAKPPSSRLGAPVIQRKIKKIPKTQFYSTFDPRTYFATREEAVRHEEKYLKFGIKIGAREGMMWSEVKKQYLEQEGLDISKYKDHFFYEKKQQMEMMKEWREILMLTSF